MVLLWTSQAGAQPADAPAVEATSEPAAAETPQAQPPSQAAANVYLIRKWAAPVVFTVTFKVDDAPATELRDGTFSALHIPPGEHDFSVKWPLVSGQLAHTFRFRVEEGKTYYFKVIGHVLGTPRFLSLGTGLAELGPAEGRTLIERCCKSREPKAGFNP